MRLGEKRLRSSEPIYVLDATPIIHFAKINKLTVALSICIPYMAREVYNETVARGGGRPDALVIHDAMVGGTLNVYDIQNRKLITKFLRHPEIDPGEAETLAAAQELNGFAIIDEAEAREVSETYGIPTRRGTVFLLLRLLALRKISDKGCENMLHELVRSGLYIDSTTLIRVKDKIRSHIVKLK